MSEELPTKLREMALTFATFGSYKAEQRLRDAADAIEGLESENAKLRDENARLRSCQSDDADNARAIIGENAHLRELCETFGMIANDAVCDYYERDEMLERANATARELGVEL